MSRGPVREALRFLEQEHLIVRQPHRGLFVAAPSRAEIYDVACLRTLLEVYALRWGELPGDEEIERLRDILASMEAAEKSENPLEAVRSDLAFHAAIAGRSRNSILARKHRELDGYMALYFHATLTQAEKGLSGLTDRHREILRALERRDLFEVGLRIEEHYNDLSLGCDNEGLTPGPILMFEEHR